MFYQFGTDHPVCVQGEHRHHLADFNHVLQQIAEEKGLLPLDDPSMDDWVPESVVSDYVIDVLKQCNRVLQEMELVDLILANDFLVAPDMPIDGLEAGLEASPDQEDWDGGDWDGSDSAELKPPAELTNYSDMSPVALQPPVSSSSSPEMQRQMSSSKVPPLRLGRASGPVPSLSAANSARKSPGAMQSPPPRLDLQKAVSSGRVPPLQLSQSGSAPAVPSLKLGGSTLKAPMLSAASSLTSKAELFASAASSPAQSSGDGDGGQSPSSNEQAGSSGGRVPPLRLGKGLGGAMVPSLQLASASGGEPTLQRTTTNATDNHNNDVQGFRESEAASALRISSPSGSEPDLLNVENVTQLPVPPMRVGKNSAAVPPLQLGASKRAPAGIPETKLAPETLQSHPLTNRSEESARSARRAQPSPVVVKAVEGMDGAQVRQPREALQGATTDTMVAGSSQVVPDEPTPRRQVVSSRQTSQPNSARPQEKLSSRRPSEAPIALREGLSARHVYDGAASHRSSTQAGVGRRSSQMLHNSLPSLEYSSRPNSSRLSHRDAVEGPPSARAGTAASGANHRDERPRSSRHAEWQSTTRDYSQPGTAPYRGVPKTGNEQTTTRADSAQLSSNGRGAVMQGLADGPQRAVVHPLSIPQRKPSPALASPVQSSLSSPSTSVRLHPSNEKYDRVQWAVADGRVQVDRHKADGASGRIKLRGRPPDESGSSGPISDGPSPKERPEPRRPSSGPTKTVRSSLAKTTTVQNWRGSRPERPNSGSKRADLQPYRGSPERVGTRRSAESHRLQGQGPPLSPAGKVRQARAGNPVKESPERAAPLERQKK